MMNQNVANFDRYEVQKKHTRTHKIFMIKSMWWPSDFDFMRIHFCEIVRIYGITRTTTTSAHASLLLFAIERLFQVQDHSQCVAMCTTMCVGRKCAYLTLTFARIHEEMAN